MDNVTYCNEKIVVVAVFDGSMHHCRPLQFKRSNGRVIDIKEIGLRHPVAAGRKTLHIYDVTDGAADYRLEFDSELLTWRLTIEGDRT